MGIQRHICFGLTDFLGSTQLNLYNHLITYQSSEKLVKITEDIILYIVVSISINCYSCKQNDAIKYGGNCMTLLARVVGGARVRIFGILSTSLFPVLFQPFPIFFFLSPPFPLLP